MFDFERREGQDFVVDVVLHVDTRAAAASDDLADTVHYGELAEQVHAVVTGEPVDLIETLAGADRRRRLAPDGCRRRRRRGAQAAGAGHGRVRRRRRARPPPPGRLVTAPVRDVPVVLALGTNLGDREAVLRSAVAALAASTGSRVRRGVPGGRDRPGRRARAARLPQRGGARRHRPDRPRAARAPASRSRPTTTACARCAGARGRWTSTSSPTARRVERRPGADAAAPARARARLRPGAVVAGRPRRRAARRRAAARSPTSRRAPPTATASGCAPTCVLGVPR